MSAEEEAKRHARKLIIWARLGYAARGLVYLIVGYLAILAAIGSGGRTTGSEGAVASMLGEPFGKALLSITAIGLLGYAAWRSMQGLADADDHGTDAKGLAIRGGLLVSAVTHTLLAVFAFSLVIGTGGGSGGGSGDWTAKLMQAPAGRWLVAAVGIAVIGAGIAQMVKGWKETFRKYLSAGPDTMRWAAPVGRWGLIVKGVVFLIIGGFLILAAVQADPSEARGLGGALDAVRSQPFGRVLLGLVAVGLIFFAAYSAIEARFRRIGT